MKHIANRLLKYAKGRLIDMDSITNPVLKRFLKEERSREVLKKTLKQMGYEILLSKEVGEEAFYSEDNIRILIREKYAENINGKLVVNLTKLRKESYMLYYGMCVHLGNVNKKLKEWGFDVIYDDMFKESGVEYYLDEISENGKVYFNFDLPEHRKLYRAVYYHAAKKHMTVDDYLEQLGYKRDRKRRKKKCLKYKK